MSKKLETKYVVSAEDKTKEALQSIRNNLKQTESTAGLLKQSMGGLSGSFGSVSKIISSFKGGPVTIALAAIGAATVGASAAMLKLATDAAIAVDNMAEMAAGINMTAGAFDQLSHEARKAGMDSEKFATAMRNMNNLIVDAADGSDKASKTLDKLRLSAEKMKNVSADEALVALTARLNEIENPIERAAMASEIFGAKLGTKMIPFLDAGADSLNQIRQAYDNATPNDDIVNKANALTNSLEDMKRTASGFGKKLLEIFGDDIIALVDKMNSALMITVDRFSVMLTKLHEMDLFKNILSGIAGALNVLYPGAGAFAMALSMPNSATQQQAQPSGTGSGAKPGTTAANLTNKLTGSSTDDKAKELREAIRLIETLNKEADKLNLKKVDLEILTMEDGAIISKARTDVQNLQLEAVKLYETIASKKESILPLDTIKELENYNDMIDDISRRAGMSIPTLDLYDDNGVARTFEEIEKQRDKIRPIMLEAKLRLINIEEIDAVMDSLGLKKTKGGWDEMTSSYRTDIPLSFDEKKTAVQDEMIKRSTSVPVGVYDQELKDPTVEKLKAISEWQKTVAGQFYELAGAGQSAAQVMADSFMNVADGISNVLGGAVGQLFDNLIAGGENTKIMVGQAFKEMAVSILSNLASVVIKMLLVTVIAKALGFKVGKIPIETITGGIPVTGKAIGGDVNMGQPYIVGEKGPELFVPSRYGRIVPNDKMQRGSRTVAVTNHISIESKGDIFSDRLAMARLAEEINTRIEDSVKKTYYAPSAA